MKKLLCLATVAVVFWAGQAPVARADTISTNFGMTFFSDNGGNPSGTILAETTFTPTTAAAHRYYGLFDDSASLAAGTVYHVVRTVTNGSADDSITLALLGGAGSDFQNSAKTGQPDPWQTSVYPLTAAPPGQRMPRPAVHLISSRWATLMVGRSACRTISVMDRVMSAARRRVIILP